MMPASRRFFLCNGLVVEYKDLYKHPRAHILGEVRRWYVAGSVNGTVDTRQFSILSVYDFPWEADRVPPVRPVFIMDVIGDVRNMACRFRGCSNVSRWKVGKDGLVGLLLEYEEVFVRK